MGLIFISENACQELQDKLAETGHDIYKVKATDVVYDAIAAHPDIYMCAVKDTLIVDECIETEPPLKEQYMDQMESQFEDAALEPIIPALTTGSGDIVFEMGAIGHDYPFDIPYNAVSTDRFFIHNTEYTAPALIDRARYAGLQIINVKQGYTKCSCIPVGSRAIITEDEGIARTLTAYNRMILEDCEDDPRAAQTDTIDVLLIRKGYAALEGFEYGFIGGTCGTIGDKIYFNGNLSDHPDFEIICSFIESHGFTPVWTQDTQLTDIGSIIYLP